MYLHMYMTSDFSSVIKYENFEYFEICEKAKTLRQILPVRQPDKRDQIVSSQKLMPSDTCSRKKSWEKKMKKYGR